MPDYNIWDSEDKFTRDWNKLVTNAPYTNLTNNKNTNVGDVAIFIPPKDKTILFYFIVVLYTTMVLACLIFNSLFAFVLIRGVQSYKKPFLRIVWQFVLANFIASISNIITTFPPTFILDQQQSESFISSVFYQFVNFFDNLCDQLVMFMCLVIAAHRLFIFMFPIICETLFTGKNLNIILCVTWVISFAITIQQLLCGCFYKWTYSVDYNGRFVFSCTNVGYKPYIVLMERVLMVEVILFPAICIVCYIMIFLKISSQRQQSSRNTNKTENEILKQAAVLFVAFQMSSIVSYTSLSVSNIDKQAFLARRIVNTVELFAGTSTPLLFFITSKELREGVGRSKPLWFSNIEKSFSKSIKVYPVVRSTSRQSFTTKTAVSTL